MSHPSRFLPLFALVLTACPGEQHGDDRASFADATEMEREAAIHSGLGTGPALGFVSLIALEQDALASVAAGGCIAVELLAEDPPVVRIEAEACVGASGTEWDGVVIAENASLVVELLEVVDGDTQLIEGPMRLEFQALSMTTGGAVLHFDGTVEQTATEWGAPFRSIVDLETHFGLASFATVATWDCSYDDDAVWCDLEPDAEGSVPGLGSFAMGGGYTLGGAAVAPSGQLVLTGADELRVDLSDLDDAGCAPVTVDGVEVQRFCLGEGSVDPNPDHEIASGGIGCDASSWYLDATVTGEGVALVRTTLYADGGVEIHHLPRVEVNDVGAFHQLQVAIGDTYLPGVSSAVACATDDTGVTSADALIEAVDADGEILACLVVGQGGRVPAEACAG